MVSGPSQYKILVVDDEPDVLAVTKLALGNMDVMGLPLVVEGVAGKAEAIAYYEAQPSWMHDVAVAIIDVVMESDSAGLELCEYIREVAQDRTVQIYIRTGQPGVAPEREVIDRYDISGYFTKAEATEEKLYSMIKAGTRQHDTTRNLAGALAMLEGVIAVGHSREAMKARFLEMLSGFLPAQ
ncbi:MAG: response regulator, partial [Actinomycetota bacterium]